MKMKTIRNGMVGLVTVAVVAIAGFSAPETRLHAAALSEPVIVTEGGECAVHCGPFGCPSGWHLAILTMQSFLNSEWGSGPHYDFNCYPGTCDDEHPECDQIEGEELEVLRLALAGDDVLEAARFINQHSARVVMNLARSAVQVSSCRGEIVAHLPVDEVFSRRVWRALAAPETQSEP